MNKEWSKLNEKEKFKGFCIDLLAEIAEICKINFTIYLVADGKYGLPGENGQWNGLVRELIEGVSVEFMKLLKFFSLHNAKLSVN